MAEQIPRGDTGNVPIFGPGGLKLATERFGTSTGMPAVFLHGGGQSRSAWRGTARRLADAGYRSCTVDLRGHGDSGWSNSREYAFGNYVADLVAVIDALGGAPAVLVGASLGGHIALLTAAQHPSKACALALADVTPWIDETAGDSMRAALRAMAAGFATLAEAGAAITQLRGAEMRVGGNEKLRRHLQTGPDGRFYFRWDVRLMDDVMLRGGGEGGLFQSAAERLALPILVMRAERSTITTADQVDAFRRVQPDLQTALIAGAGHMVTGDVNDAYADAILPFLAQHFGREAGVSPCARSPIR